MINNILICCICSGDIDWGLVWNFLTAISTLGLFGLTFWIVIFAKGQLKTSNKIANSDFSLRLKNDFFTKETRELFMLFENDLLIYKHNPEIDFHYFEIDKTKLKKYPILSEVITNKEKLIYTSSEVEDLLLNQFEDIGIFEENKILSIKSIYEGFSHYLETVFESKQIVDYLKAIRESDKDDSDFYDKFEAIYNKTIEYGKQKRK